ncbi:hypothetical protein SAMN05421730_103313 [Anaerobium acetethylicum]|uniref:Uncharacterized protein n=1 Tax=Anaerobium acetethylicum TaxID=1619234 RepID=A0A1D3TXR2_9FIRM|nr:hypothetical protein SAMN05421730_103313 [Anaerobium acetethylicum]
MSKTGYQSVTRFSTRTASTVCNMDLEAGLHFDIAVRTCEDTELSLSTRNWIEVHVASISNILDEFKDGTCIQDKWHVSQQQADGSTEPV